MEDKRERKVSVNNGQLQLQTLKPSSLLTLFFILLLSWQNMYQNEILIQCISDTPPWQPNWETFLWPWCPSADVRGAKCYWQGAGWNWLNFVVRNRQVELQLFYQLQSRHSFCRCSPRVWPSTFTSTSRTPTGTCRPVPTSTHVTPKPKTNRICLLSPHGNNIFSD